MFQEAYNEVRISWLRDRKQRHEEEKQALQVKALLIKAQTSKKGKDNGKECWNPFHGTDKIPRKGHTIDECYTEGGGKAGQAPWNKNKNRPITNTSQVFAPNVTPESAHAANLMQVSSPMDVYTLSAQSESYLSGRYDSHGGTHPTPTSPNLDLPDRDTSSDSILGEEVSVGEAVMVSMINSSHISKDNTSESICTKKTYLDSSAMHHCWVKRSSYVEYTAVTN